MSHIKQVGAAIGIAVPLFGGLFWLGNLSATVESHEKQLDKVNDRLMRADQDREHIKQHLIAKQIIVPYAENEKTNNAKATPDGTIVFHFNSAQMQPSSGRVIDDITQQIVSSDDQPTVIRLSKIGTSQGNLKVEEERKGAIYEAIIKSLSSKGLSQEHLSVETTDSTLLVTPKSTAKKKE